MSFIDRLAEALNFAVEEGDSSLIVTEFDGDIEIEDPDGTIVRMSGDGYGRLISLEILEN